MLNINHTVKAPIRRYLPDDRISLTRTAHPASIRRPVPGVNVPSAGETLEELNRWRVRYGLPLVTTLIRGKVA
jgi:hypothetical protein